jgi:ATP-dependent DNA helicase DinG
VLQLRQGFGRLIRSHADRGVVAVLDPRLRTKAYGRAFLASLPACPVVEDRSAVAAFFGAGAAATA